MRLDDIPLPPLIRDQLVAQESFSHLYPPQSATIHAGLFTGTNLVVAIPTASGKTFVAELCALHHILVRKQRVIYLSPLRALASEKYEEFKRFRSLGIKVGLTTGDYDSPDLHLSKFDFIIATNEKVDSLLRHRLEFVQNDVSLLIVDECHVLDDPSRGPTLETLLVKIRMLNPEIQILALSATVGNAEEIASWLRGTLILSDWRPVPLEEAFCTEEGVLHYRKGGLRTINQAPGESVLEGLVRETLEEEGQVLVFAPSRKSAQKTARSLTKVVSQFLTKKEQEELGQRLTVLGTNSAEDKQTQELAKLLMQGVCFHHAGLSSSQRKIVEAAFKDRLVKVLTATPTLAAGVNLPARRVIITSIWRFSDQSGRSVPIKTLDYEQMRGRSGRPRYDPKGEAILLVGKDRDQQIIWDHYYSDKGPEDIESKLAARPALRIQLLGVLSSGLASDYTGVSEFLNQTLFAHHYGDSSELENVLQRVLRDLERFGFVVPSGESLVVTLLGRRVSQLYIDPVTAYNIITGMSKALQRGPPWSYLGMLYVFTQVPDIRRLRLRRQDWEKVQDAYNDCKSQLYHDEVPFYSTDYPKTLEGFQTAQVMMSWISEVPIPSILETSGLALGDFHRLLETVQWISYSASVLSEQLSVLKDLESQLGVYYPAFQPAPSKDDLQSLSSFLKGLEIRLEHGIAQDLMPLVALKGLGRVKSRALVRHGLVSPEAIRDASVEDLLRVPGIGPQLSMELKAQVGVKVSLEDLERLATAEGLGELDDPTPSWMVHLSPSSSTEKPTKKGRRSLLDFL